jgi:hypothetical protein
MGTALLSLRALVRRVDRIALVHDLATDDDRGRTRCRDHGRFAEDAQFDAEGTTDVDGLTAAGAFDLVVHVHEPECRTVVTPWSQNAET